MRLPSQHETIPSGEVAQSSGNSPCNIVGGGSNRLISSGSALFFIPASSAQGPGALHPGISASSITATLQDVEWILQWQHSFALKMFSSRILG